VSGCSSKGATDGSGGATNKGGASAGGAGGGSGAGGSKATGGSTTTGGAGGAAGAGGSKATGGSATTGGAGGAAGAGGSKATGGSTSNGGVGGLSASGGAGGKTGGAGGASGAGGAGGTGGISAAADDCTSPAKGDVTLSVPSGTFQGTLSVELATSISGAEIRYTTDGTAPTSASPKYSSALSLTKTTRLRAQAFVNGTASGALSGALYVARRIDATHDLPVIILDSFGSGKLPTAEAQRQFVDVAYLAFEPSSGTASISGTPTHASFAAFHVRGNSSAMFDKVPYRLELRDPVGEDRDCPVLGMPAESDWALVGPHADKTLIHNNFVYELGREMGMQAPRVKLAEVYVNVNDEPIEDTDYQGVYQVVETIKNQKDRLNLKQLNETKLDDAQITGGYIFSFEWSITAENPLPCPSGTADGWSYMELVDPIPVATKQKDWLVNHLVNFNKAVHSSNRADATSGYPNYIETQSFADTIIINELTRNMDGLVRSQYFFKDRDKKINAGPLWDFDLIAGVGLNPGSLMAGTLANTGAEGWQYEGNASRMSTTNPTPKADAGVPDAGTKRDAGFGWPGGGGGTTQAGTTDWFPVLLSDPTFKSQLIARWKSLRGNLLSDSAMDSRIDGLTKNLTAAADRNFKRWNILSQAQVSPFDTPTASTYAAQIAFMKDWLNKRAAWLDGQWK